MNSLMDHAIEAATMAVLGLCTFLVRSFFSRIHEDLKLLRSSIDKIEGRFQAIQEGARETHTQLAVTRQEMKAVWRSLDGAHRRASDLNGNEEGE